MSKDNRGGPLDPDASAAGKAVRRLQQRRRHAHGGVFRHLHLGGRDEGRDPGASLDRGEAVLRFRHVRADHHLKDLCEREEPVYVGLAVLLVYTGSAALRDGKSAFTKGFAELKAGAKALADGTRQFDEERIGKIVSLFDGDLQGLLDRVRAVADGSAVYTSYVGIAEGASGSVRFIFRTDAVG